MITTPSRELVANWLADAHAMEVALEKTLSRQADHAKDNPDLQRAILEHVEVTRHQAERLKQCLARFGDSTSFLKDTAAKFSGFMQGGSTWAMGDTAVKDILMGIGAEHFEVACYRALETACHAIGDEETARVAHEIRQEEQDYLMILEDRLPQVVEAEVLHAGRG